MSTNRGFAALLTVIILSLTLLAIVVDSSADGFALRLAALDDETKQASASLADACINTALLKYIEDPSYGGNEDIPVGSETCHIYDIAPSGSRVRLTAGASYQKAYTYLAARFDVSDPSHPAIECRREVPFIFSLSPPC